MSTPAACIDALARRPLRVCMVTHSFYESDNRILRYAETLAARGDHVEVLALRRKPGLPDTETINSVVLHRVQDRFGKGEGGSLSYLWPLVRFTLVAGSWLARRPKRETFDVIHVHNVPDFLVFAALPSRWRGAKVILDIHDIVPEFFGSKFKAGPESMLGKALRVMEKVSASVAHRVILANHLWFETYTRRSAPSRKISVFINYVDEAIFQPREARPQAASPIVIFPGGLHWHQGLDIAIRAFADLKNRLPEARLHIHGDGSAKHDLECLVQELGLGDRVHFHEPVGLREIARIMSEADLGVVPKRADSFGNEAYSTKIMEFMALGVPVVISSTRIDRYYFNDSVARFFDSGDVQALADAMFEVLTTPALRESLIANSAQYVHEHGWSQHKHRYLALVDELAGSTP